MDYGFEAAGFGTRVALEMDRDAATTLRANRPSWVVIQDDIKHVDSDALLRAAELKKGEADILFGGPPCQPFSKAGYWASGDAGRLDDPRAQTLEEYLRVVEDTLPKTFVLENVSGMAYSGKEEGLAFLLSRIDEINRRQGTAYEPHFQVLRAADYGVPQIRDRFILVAAREGQPFGFPSPTHAMREEGSELPFGEPYLTAWDAIGDLPEPEEDLRVRGKWGDLLPSIPEGENYLFHTERGDGEPLFGWRRRYWSFLLKLAKRRPSWTLQAQPGPAIGPFHWNNRRLSARELCRLQTFPDDVVVMGSHQAVQRQVGNAVPSLLAEVLGRAIREQLLGMPVNGPLSLLPSRKTPVPPAERRARVPKQYLHLRGRHLAHPGTGKGFRASER
jgi:DNA (cytosine-5)-methyltransferase 1